MRSKIAEIRQALIDSKENLEFIKRAKAGKIGNKLQYQVGFYEGTVQAFLECFEILKQEKKS